MIVHVSILDAVLTGRLTNLLHLGGVELEIRALEIPDYYKKPQGIQSQDQLKDFRNVENRRQRAANPGDVRPAPRRQKRKKYNDRTPSNHCHICSRSSGAVKMAVCANMHVGFCRKVICKLCCDTFNLGVEKYDNNQNWLCTHCQGTCPSRARCFTYNKTNGGRRTSAHAS
mmetsp:Transcript_39021/g.154556  ORF Transcript_39021/g.154556 Transcript_39021/m.154556 type:complete len:171 (-) Transcript_39021:1537-2049(-)